MENIAEMEEGQFTLDFLANVLKISNHLGGRRGKREGIFSQQYKQHCVHAFVLYFQTNERRKNHLGRKNNFIILDFTRSFFFFIKLLKCCL